MTTAIDLNPNARLFQSYQILDVAAQRMASLGVPISRAWLEFDGAATLFRGEVEKELDEGKTPFVYQYPEVRVSIDQRHFGNYWDVSDEERQKAREEFIEQFMKKYPDTLTARYDGTSVLYFENQGLGVAIEVGQALCKRVLVDTVTELVPDPDAPKIEQTREVYEWRCNDAEFV